MQNETVITQFEALSQCLLGKEENNKTLSQNSWYLANITKRLHPTYKSDELQLELNGTAMYTNKRLWGESRDLCPLPTNLHKHEKHRKITQKLEKKKKTAIQDFSKLLQ
jgi:hypothetical protein